MALIIFGLPFTKFVKIILSVEKQPQTVEACFSYICIYNIKNILEPNNIINNNIYKEKLHEGSFVAFIPIC